MRLYKNTIIVCFLFAAITMIAAFVFQFFNPQGFLLLFQNICIGLSCSSVLVIVPTFLQYMAEKTDKLKQLENLLIDISIAVINGSCEDLTDKQYKTIAEQLRESFSELINFQIEYITIIPEERKKIANKIAPIVRSALQFTVKENRDSYVAAVRNLVNTEKGKEIVRITIQMTERDILRGIFEDYLGEVLT